MGRNGKRKKLRRSLVGRELVPDPKTACNNAHDSNALGAEPYLESESSQPQAGNDAD